MHDREKQTIRVESARETDLPQLVSLMQGYLQFYGRQHGDEEVYQHAAYLLDHPQEGIQFIVWLDDEPVGFATLYFTLSTLGLRRSAILNDIYVAEQARGGGAAEELFRHCLAYVRSNGYAGMEWATAKDNSRAQRFYDKMEAKTGEWLHYTI
ncbi:GNAT family N-acetyltransferase [Brevibacillus humidisoli]|uniref:GNAT family N-acetyltransferase n=1 Tax=Brevibacillus humidisoli TaxID=2895522 RepID=UPI001E4850D0|nr:GNAT family N-acetyltransferase [Brevibacillus humidisoli]UFJ41606.1 GNAT family N-acetyltransferase [Brevibacillus humidisoli]